MRLTLLHIRPRPWTKAVLCFGLLLASCSRHAELEPLRDAVLVSGATGQDVSLALLPPSQEVLRRSLEIDADIPTSDLLRTIDHLDSLARATGDDNLRSLATRLHAAFYENPANFDSSPFARSLYADAAIGEGEAMVRPYLDEASRDLESVQGLALKLLERSRREFPWPKSLSRFTAALEVADQYVAWLDSAVPALGLPPKLANLAQNALRGAYAGARPRFAASLTSLERARSLAEALSALDSAARQFGITLPPAQRAQLAQGRDLAKMLAGLETPQDALTMLISVWRSLSAADRQSMQKISSDLYEYLSGKSETELDCLAAKVCFNPIIAISKPILLDKIGTFGVARIGTYVDQAARDFLLREVLSAIVRLLPQAPALAAAKVKEEAARYRALLTQAQRDFGGFARARLDAWAKSRLPTPIAGLEAERVRLTLRVGQTRADAQRGAGQIQVSGGEALGLGLTLAPAFLPSDPGKRKSALLAPVVKLLAMGGFRQPGGATFPSLLYALDGKPGDLFEIRGLLGGQISFAVPDRFSAKGMILDRVSARADASASAQAELLRGIARQIRFLRDWEENAWDSALGSFQAGELVPEVPAGAIDYPLFPKSLAFALALGNAGAILQNVVRPLSPAFLWMRKGEIFWGDRYQELKGTNVSTVAGLVSIVAGQRDRTVRTADVARYVLALDEFLSATEGVERTSAAPLRDRTTKGGTVLDELADARGSLRLLQMALANYLVSVAQDKDGTMAARRRLPSLDQQGAEPAELRDQALAIRALLASAQSLNIPVFRYAALDTFYAMNRKFFDPTRQFYAAGPKGQAPSVADLTLVLLAGEELSPWMPASSAGQWRRISRPWLRALGEL